MTRYFTPTKTSFHPRKNMTHKGSLAPPRSRLSLRPSPALCQREGLGRECKYYIPTVRECILGTLGFRQPPLWRRWLVFCSATSLLVEPSRKKTTECFFKLAENRISIFDNLKNLLYTTTFHPHQNVSSPSKKGFRATQILFL